MSVYSTGEDSGRGPLEESLAGKLGSKFVGDFLRIRNESMGHGFQQTVDTGSSVKETHFNILVVSQQFQGLSLLKRHRLVQLCIAEEAKQLRAVSLHTHTVAEWEQVGEQNARSPSCASTNASTK